MYKNPILFDKDFKYTQCRFVRSLFFLMSILLCFLSLSPAFSETFAFKYHKGDTARVLSTTDEDVFINGNLSHHSTIVSRISEETIAVTDDNSGILKTHFMTTEQANITNDNSIYKWGKEYESQYTCSPQGEYNISDEYFMPVVRNVPVFLKTDVKIGDTWTAQGTEAHDLRDTLGIETPYKIPFTANYTYEGIVQENGKTLHVIAVTYNIMYKTPKITTNATNYPVKNFIYSNEKLYWDNKAGALLHYTEDFRIMFEMSLGDIYEFVGTAHAEITDLQKQGTQENADKIQKQIDAMDIKDTKAEVTERGIKISLEKIRFKAESAQLMDSEKEKLNKIASILKTLPPDNDLLIGGHTAKWGSAESQMSLSEQRAATVAQYLISLQVRDPSAIFTKGYGATEPIAPNDTEENMARNRRVEITILDK
jgi:outer membrane protein OmpA-like peptidoglycan-associated protein